MTLITEITKRNFFALIETAENAVITEENIKETYEVFKRLGEIEKYLVARLKTENKPDKDRIDARNEAFKTYTGKLAALFEKIEPILYAVNGGIKTKERLKRNAARADNVILVTYSTFVRETVKEIVLATDNKVLAGIQMAIGTEKSRETFYGKYHEKLKGTCDLLLTLVDGRKDILKTNAKLVKLKEKANAAGDIVLETQYKEEIEHNEAVYKENAENIAEQVFSEVGIIALAEEETESAAITPTTHRWSTRIDDEELLKKKHPELFMTVPDKEAIKEFLNERKDKLDKEIEHDFDGLILYYKPFYL